MRVPLSVRVWRLADTVLGSVERGLGVLRWIHTGVWLGLLGREQLHAADHLHYSRSASYRTGSGNLGGLMDWEARAVADWFDGADPLVVLAAGAGREVLALLELGHSVVGYECNPELVATGRAGGCELRPMERDRCPELDGPAGGAVLGWGLYSHLQGSATRIGLLRDLRRQLVPGAPILLSYLTRRESERRHRLVTRLAAPLRRWRGAEPVELGDWLWNGFVHQFTAAEVAAEVEAAGLELLSTSASGYGHAVCRVR